MKCDLHHSCGWQWETQKGISSIVISSRERNHRIKIENVFDHKPRWTSVQEYSIELKKVYVIKVMAEKVKKNNVLCVPIQKQLKGWNGLALKALAEKRIERENSLMSTTKANLDWANRFSCPSQIHRLPSSRQHFFCNIGSFLWFT